MKLHAATKHIAFTVSVAVAATLFAATAFAQDATTSATPAAAPMSQHPAVLLQRDVFLLKQARSIDAQTFVVAHPARLALVGGHANHEHPAMVAARQPAQLDVNAYRVQPPAATTWRNASEADASTLVATGAATPVR